MNPFFVNYLINFPTEHPVLTIVMGSSIGFLLIEGVKYLAKDR